MSDQANNAFGIFSNCFSKQMQAHGFLNLLRMRFVKQNADICILVEIQKEQQPSNRNAVRFTINVGISINRLREELRPENEVGSIEEAFDIDDCNWKKRLGTLTGEKSDVWWSVRDEADARLLCNELEKKFVLIALPQIEKMASIDSMLTSWIDGSAPGLTEYQRLSYAARLLVALDRRQEAMTAINTLEQRSLGKPWQDKAKLDIHEFRKRVREKINGVRLH